MKGKSLDASELFLVVIYWFPTRYPASPFFLFPKYLSIWETPVVPATQVIPGKADYIVEAVPGWEEQHIPFSPKMNIIHLSTVIKHCICV